MPGLSTLLFPIIWLMEQVLKGYVEVTGSVGLSILLLSLTFSVLMLPLHRFGQRAERRITDRMRQVNTEIREARSTGLRGEPLFDVTEAIYKRHHYHPIQAMLAGGSFLVSLPVLVSSIFLFRDTSIVRGVAFGPVADLGLADQLLQFGTLSVNLLPLIMLLVTMLDAFWRFRLDPESKNRFLVISVVLIVLVYTMPAGLVLYWIANNVWAFCFSNLITTMASNSPTVVMDDDPRL